MKTRSKKQGFAEKYTYRVAWSQEDDAFVARVAEWPSLAADGETMEAALAELRGVVAACIVDMEASGEAIPEPLSTRKFSGKLLLRMPPELHRTLAADAAAQDIALNQLIVARLAGGH